MTENTAERFKGWRVRSKVESRTLCDCSLIVPTFRRPEELLLLMETILPMKDVPGEVIIVDGSPENASEERLVRWARRNELPFELVYARTPAGLTRQRNVGIEISTKQYVFFLDDDCLPFDRYFQEVRRAFDRDVRVGAVGGMPINEILKPMSRRWRLRLKLHLAPHRIEPGIYHPSGTSVPRALVKPFKGVREVDMLPGCAMAFRREVLGEHRFSEFFYGYAQGEDLEMSLRVRRDWKILWCGDALVFHNHASGGRPPSFSKGVMEVRNRHFIWKRHSGDVSLNDRLRFWLDIGFLIVMDGAWFLLHPAQYGALAHAAGLAWGGMFSLLRPPRYEEPAVRNRFRLELSELAAGVETDD